MSGSNLYLSICMYSMQKDSYITGEHKCQFISVCTSIHLSTHVCYVYVCVCARTHEHRRVST